MDLSYISGPFNLNDIICNIEFRYQKDSFPSEEEECKTIDNINHFYNICTLKMIRDKLVEIEGKCWDEESRSTDEEYRDDEDDDSNDYEI